MGGGVIVVVSKNRQPLRDQQVSVTFNWIGLSTGTKEITTNNLGEAVVNGAPAFSEGKGQVKGPLGQYADFTIGTDAYGNFPRTEVQTSWNPVASGADTVKDIAGQALNAVTKVSLIGVALGVVILLVYVAVRRSPLGQIGSLAKRIRSKY